MSDFQKEMKGKKCFILSEDYLPHSVEVIRCQNHKLGLQTFKKHFLIDGDNGS